MAEKIVCSNVVYVFCDREDDGSTSLISIFYKDCTKKELSSSQKVKYFNTNASVVPVSDEQLKSKNAENVVRYANEKTGEKINEFINFIKKKKYIYVFNDYYIFNLEMIRNIRVSGHTMYVSFKGFSNEFEYELEGKTAKREYERLYDAKLQYERNKPEEQKRINKNCVNKSNLFDNKNFNTQDEYIFWQMFNQKLDLCLVFVFQYIIYIKIQNFCLLTKIQD